MLWLSLEAAKAGDLAKFESTALSELVRIISKLPAGRYKSLGESVRKQARNRPERFLNRWLQVEAAAEGACNAVLLKPNQAGTLSLCRAALDTARAAGWGAVVSARSGETEDVTVVHLALGWGVGQLKIGSIAHGERTAKWNEGLRLADTLPTGGRLPPRSQFPWGRRCG